MKLHKSLVSAVIETLQQIFVQGVYADKAVEQVLKQNSRWGSRDRRFIAENVYEMVRWWRFLVHTLDKGDGTDTPHYYELFAAWQLLKEVELPDWEEFKGIEKTHILKNAEQVKKTRKYRESIPDWLDEVATRELGETVWEKEIHELNKEAQVVLRVNTLKTNSVQLKHLLAEQSIETFPVGDYPDALVLVKRQNLQNLTEYKQGLFEIQDASSQLIAPFLDLKEGMTVIDACAGAGGKSLHMAAMINNTGNIISMDVEERKLLELKKRADRGGVRIIKTQLINDAALLKLKNTADRLLLDVPCTGLGVIRRNPDAKWKLSLEFIEGITKTQQQILQNYSQLLKPGGVMVYATCSILPSENQRQVETFLEKNKNFELIEDRKILPSEGFDGFYMAKLKKND
ncbi:MAG: methyltransferase domain-containing protein [Bacteroidetes bacterium]|nr:methyltransferase domain-containing protein [Bacteroidota bacterium]